MDISFLSFLNSETRCVCFIMDIPPVPNQPKTFTFPQHSFGVIVLGFNNASNFVGHFVSSPREREKRDRRDTCSRGDEREGW